MVRRLETFTFWTVLQLCCMIKNLFFPTFCGLIYGFVLWARIELNIHTPQWTPHFRNPMYTYSIVTFALMNIDETHSLTKNYTKHRIIYECCHECWQYINFVFDHVMVYTTIWHLRHVSVLIPERFHRLKFCADLDI